MLHTRVYFSCMCYQIAPRVLHFSAMVFECYFNQLLHYNLAPFMKKTLITLTDGGGGGGGGGQYGRYMCIVTL